MSIEHIQELMNEFKEKNPLLGEAMKVHGAIYCRTFDPTTDETKEERFVPNLITTKGFNKYLQNVFDALATNLKGTFLAIGTTATSLNASDTALEGMCQIIGGTFSHVADTLQGTVAYTFGGTAAEAWALKEMGLFDALTSGTMICRGTFDVVNKGTADSFEAKYIHSLS